MHDKLLEQLKLVYTSFYIKRKHLKNYEKCFLFSQESSFYL